MRRENGYLTLQQLLAGTHLIDVNLDLKTDRELYQTAQKRTCLAMQHTWKLR